MPFTSDNAAGYGQKGGSEQRARKDPQTVRTKQFTVKVSPAEYDAIMEKAARLSLSKPELLVQAVGAYDPEA